MLQHGSYTLLIDACYDREQFPTLEEAIDWTWASTAEEVAAVQFVLGKFFTLENGFYVQKRITEEIAEYFDFCIKQKIKGALGGRPKNPTGLENNPLETQLKPNETLTTNHKPITNNQEPITKDKKAQALSASPFVLPEWIDKQHWNAWHLHPKRKNLKPEQKQLAVNQLSKWRDAGIDYALALQNSATNNWQGLFEPKVDVTKIAYEPPYSKYMREQAEKMTPSIAAPNPNNPQLKRIDPNEFLRTIEAQNVVRIN